MMLMQSLMVKPSCSGTNKYKMRSTIVILSLIFPLLVFSQTPRLAPEPKLIPGSFTYIMPDEIGNLFVLTSGGQLKKLNASLDSIGVFNDVRRYGRLHSISSENPLRSICFFREFQTILIMDRLMQVVNKIDLRKSGIFQVQAVAQSYDNKIWVFDEQESKIKKLDEDGQVIFASADLRLIFSESISPSVIFDRGGYIYLYDKMAGLFIFDYYGTLKNRIALLGWENVQPVENLIMGIKEDRFIFYRPNTIDSKEWALPEVLRKVSQIRVTPKSVYVIKKEGVLKYDWER